MSEGKGQLAAGALCLCFGLIAGAVAGYLAHWADHRDRAQQARDDERRAAAAARVGRYVFSEKTGKAEFVYEAPAPKGMLPACVYSSKPSDN